MDTKQFVKRLRCPNGHAVGVTFKFCNFCGERLIEVYHPGCSKCGYMWVADDKFCPHCGASRKPLKLSKKDILSIRKGVQDIKEGKVSPWSAIVAKLGL